MRTKDFKRRKDNKKNWTNRCCTFVVARFCPPPRNCLEIGFGDSTWKVGPKTAKTSTLSMAHFKGGSFFTYSWSFFAYSYFAYSPLITAGFLYRAGAETALNFREKFRVFPRTILENFSGVDTQTKVLVSTAEVWISAPDTQTPIFLGFLGIHS